MNILGIGPRIAVSGAVTAVAVIIFKQEFGFSIPLPIQGLEKILGILFCVIGLYFWISSAILVKVAFDSKKLVTSGVYGFSRNPMYAAFIVFIVPGISFLVNDLFFLLPSGVMFLLFKLQIKKEEEFLAQEFGEEYKQYEKAVAQLIPFLHF